LPSSPTSWSFVPLKLDDQTPITPGVLLRLRGEIDWPTPEALKAQIFRDVARREEILPGWQKPPPTR